MTFLGPLGTKPSRPPTLDGPIRWAYRAPFRRGGDGPLNTVPIISIAISHKVQGLAGAAAPVVRAVQKGLGIGIANHDMNPMKGRRGLRIGARLTPTTAGLVGPPAARAD